MKTENRDEWVIETKPKGSSDESWGYFTTPFGDFEIILNHFEAAKAKYSETRDIRLVGRSIIERTFDAEDVEKIKRQHEHGKKLRATQ